MRGLTVGTVYSYEEEALLERCLASIEAQREQLEQFVSKVHIVVVRTPQSSRRNLQFVRGQIISSTTENLGVNRSLALQSCKSDGFYFIDPDCWLSENALVDLCDQMMKAVASDPNVFACAGPNRLVSKNPSFEAFLRWLGDLKWMNGGVSQIVSNGTDRFDWHSPTCNILYWVPRLRKPYFSDRFPKYGEDLEFNFRQSRNGRKVFISNQAFVWHEQPVSRKKYFKKIFFYGISQTQLLRMHPTSFLNRRLWVLFGNFILFGLGLALPFHLFLALIASLFTVFAALFSIEMFFSKEKSSPLDFIFSYGMLLVSYSLGQISGLILPIGEKSE